MPLFNSQDILVVGADGVLTTPDLGLGAVMGIAQQILHDNLNEIDEIETRAIRVHEVCDAREVIATNAVRGACAIASIGELTISDGRPGTWCKRLQEILANA